jgi:hypothetical protein
VHRVRVLVSIAVAAGCGGTTAAPPSSDGSSSSSGSPGGPVSDGGNPPDGAVGDTTTPYPIDMGGRPGAPATYKGLPLEIVDNGTPVVTPVNGRVGLVCIGMSNATQECSDFRAKLATGALTGKKASVIVVDCAVGGHAIERWNDPAFDATLWDACVQTKIPAAGLAVAEARVVYHKAADQFATGTVLYPAPASDYVVFQQNLTTFAGRLATKLPSVQAVYTTSRSYGGFAQSINRGEPLSYEEGHALNAWLASNKTVGSVWYGWGPYIWAPDCASGVMNASGVCYVRADYVQDGIHPAPSGRSKISTMIHARFMQHAWYAE